MNKKSALNKIKNINNEELQDLLDQFDALSIEKNECGNWQIFGLIGNCWQTLAIAGSTYENLITNADRFYLNDNLDDDEDVDDALDNY